MVWFEVGAVVGGFVVYLIGYATGLRRGYTTGTKDARTSCARSELIERQVRCNTCKFVHWKD